MCPRHAAWKVALAITSLLLGCGARTSLDAPPRRDAAIEDAIPARDAETDGRIVEVDAAICGGECDDGIYCNGREVCDGLTRRCQPGPPPSCDDGIECTVDSCDPGVDACRSEPVDRDGDGDGVSACDGDCDDADPARYPGAAELCDGLDQDCDGEIDEGALSECGDCRPGCQILSMPGETGGWGVRAGSSGGVAVDPSGGLRLDTSRTETNHAWIANSAPGTVTKLDMRTGAQLAEFDSALLDGRNGARPAGERCQTERLGGNCPSRTAIDLRGNVYVANRAFFAQGTVTKIAGAVDDCVDRNRNLRIDTSRDLDGNGLIDRSTPGEFLGQDDECILWTVDVGGVGGLPRAIAVAADGGVWVGLHDGRRVLELDPLTGGTRRSIAIAFNPYGAAIDSRARLWLLEVGSGRITSIDTSTGERGETVVTTDRSDCAGGYGIAIDSRDRVWTAGFQCPVAYRYDPAVRRVAVFPLPDSGATRGVAADDRGYVYLVASHTEIRILPIGLEIGAPIARVTRMRADDGGDLRIYGTPSAPLPGLGTVGVGLDSSRRLWLVNQDSGTVTRLDPESGEAQEYPVGDMPYTYSDFTGYALRTFTAPSGYHRRVLEGCLLGPTEWERLSWDAELPAGSRLSLRLRSAASLLELQTAPWLGPFDSQPADLLLPPGPVPSLRFLEVELMLVSDDGATSPRVLDVSIRYNCPV